MQSAIVGRELIVRQNLSFGRRILSFQKEDLVCVGSNFNSGRDRIALFVVACLFELSILSLSQHATQLPIVRSVLQCPTKHTEQWILPQLVLVLVLVRKSGKPRQTSCRRKWGGYKPRIWISLVSWGWQMQPSLK